jgi:hypothetical protein
MTIIGIASSGSAIAGYLFLQRWGVKYEQQMGTGLPLLSSRIRRIFLGEILILIGIIFMLGFGMTLGIFTIIGEIFVGSNLIRSGKLLELDTFPQMPSFVPEPSRPRENQEFPEFKEIQEPPSDKASYCPFCGAKLVSVSQDFCMKCGAHIPRPDI